MMIVQKWTLKIIQHIMIIQINFKIPIIMKRLKQISKRRKGIDNEKNVVYSMM